MDEVPTNSPRGHVRLWVTVIVGHVALFGLAAVTVEATVIPRVGFLPVPSLHLFWPGVVFSQASLLAIWTALRGRPRPWRVMGLTLAMVPIAWFVVGLEARPTGYSFAVPLAVVFIVLALGLGITIPLLLLRLAGLRVESPNDSGGVEKLQFSLKQLFAWVTTAAVVLSVLKLVPPAQELPLPPTETLIVFAALLAPVPAVLLWVALGNRGTLLRLAVLAPIAALPLLINLLPIFFAVDQMVEFFIPASAFWTLGTLFLFRHAGYRLAWRGRTAIERPNYRPPHSLNRLTWPKPSSPDPH